MRYINHQPREPLLNHFQFTVTVVPIPASVTIIQVSQKSRNTMLIKTMMPTTMLVVAKRGCKTSSRNNNNFHTGIIMTTSSRGGSPPALNHSRFPVSGMAFQYFKKNHPSNKVIVNKTGTIITLARRGKADISSTEALETRFRNLEKRWDDRTVYEKRLDVIGDVFGKRLDDFATRIVSSERGFLFLVVGLVGFFGVLTKQSADLNQKIDKQSADLNQKIDKQSADLNQKIDKQSADLNQKIDKQSADLNQKIDKLAASIQSMDKQLHIISTELRRLSSSRDEGHVPPTSNN
jgi:uncharacterized membrane-anchored protein YhcB (DUF1043 family)